MAHPARLGQLVLWNATYSVEQNPAIIVSIPKYVIGGKPNDDGAGNPLIVDLMVFTMQGMMGKYHVAYNPDYVPSTWSPMPEESTV